MGQDNRTSLEKSHSVASNAKLTLICFLMSLCFAALWLGFGLAFTVEDVKVIGYIIGGVGAAGMVLTLFLIGKFTR